MKKMKGLFLLLPLMSLLVTNCFESGTIETPPEEQDLVEPFTNEITGYYSNLALELEGVFTGIIEMDMSGMSDQEKDSFVSGLRSDRWTVLRHAGDQMKYGKKQLNTEKLHMNLSTNDIESFEVAREGDRAKISYSLRNETLIMNDDLAEAGIDPNNFTTKHFSVRLPADPRNIFSRVGDACAEGFDEGDLADHNYFYYFNPDKPGCNLPMVTATFTLNSLLPRKNTYPEYDKLTADRKVTVAVFFGAAKHENPPPDNDWGVWEHNDFVRDLRSRGFSKVQDLDPKGVRYKRTRSGIEEIVDVVSPYDLSALNHDTNGLFKTALQTHEIVAYLGHSFYGSLNVLRDRSAYPENTYQIIYMNSCWSYEYYTKQVFENKATPRDPRGWELADVVNNTEVGWFSHNADEARILLTNLFAGCESGGATYNRRYDWDGIIQAMNRFALDNIPYGEDQHEIYGVSGVTNNCYDPRDPNRCSCTDECNQAGYKECAGNAVRTCTNHDDDPCLEWSSDVPCKPDEVCRDGVCEFVCNDDGLEENDTPETAETLTAGDHGTLKICMNNDDWYRFELEAGETLEVEVLFAHSSGDIDVQLFAEGNYQNSVTGSTSSTDNERVSHLLESRGALYLKVFGYSSAQNSYQLVVTILEAQETCTDECSEEGQRRCSGDAYQVCSADHDEDDCLEWGPEVSCNGLGCQDGYCNDPNPCTDECVEGERRCDGDGYQVCGHHDSDQCVEWGEVISCNGLACQDGRCVDACNDECTTQGDRRCQGDGYQVCGNHDSDECLEWGEVVSCNGLACQDGQCVEDSNCSDDAYEHNDAQADASAISGGSYDLQVCANDDDWYRIELEAGDQLQVSISFTHADGDLDMELIDPAGQSQSSTSTNDSESLSAEAASAGTFYLKVYGYQGAENSYSLAVEVSSSGNDTCDDDSFEQNDDRAHAHDLHNLTVGPNSYPNLQICADDEDWFGVYVYSGETLKVDLDFIHADGDLDVKLVDLNESVLASGLSVDDDESVEFTATSDGAVYIRIYGFSNAENAYGMVITVQQP